MFIYPALYGLFRFGLAACWPPQPRFPYTSIELNQSATTFIYRVTRQLISQQTRET